MQRGRACLTPVLAVDMRSPPCYTFVARRDGRVDDGGGLENHCGGLRHRGFESLSLRLLQFDLLGRCQSGRLGPPAKRLTGYKPVRRFESCSPRTNAASSPCGVFLFMSLFFKKSPSVRLDLTPPLVWLTIIYAIVKDEG